MNSFCHSYNSYSYVFVFCLRRGAPVLHCAWGLLAEIWLRQTSRSTVGSGCSHALLSHTLFNVRGSAQILKKLWHACKCVCRPRWQWLMLPTPKLSNSSTSGSKLSSSPPTPCGYLLARHGFAHMRAEPLSVYVCLVLIQPLCLQPFLPSLQPILQ